MEGFWGLSRHGFVGVSELQSAGKCHDTSRSFLALRARQMSKGMSGNIRKSQDPSAVGTLELSSTMMELMTGVVIRSSVEAAESRLNPGVFSEVSTDIWRIQVLIQVLMSTVLLT